MRSPTMCSTLSGAKNSTTEALPRHGAENLIGVGVRSLEHHGGGAPADAQQVEPVPTNVTSWPGGG